MGSDLLHAFVFWREEENLLKKVGIGAGIAILPVLGHMVLLGFLVGMFRNIIDDVPDDRVLPEWDQFGEFFFKGLPLGGVAICYGIAFAIIAGLLTLIFGLSLLIEGQGWLATVAMWLLGTIVFYAFNVFFWAAASFYAQELEIGPSFNIAEVLVRIAGMGKEYFIFIAIMTVATVLALFVSFAIPILPVSLIVWNFCMFFSMIVTFYGVGQVVAVDFHPELHDPLNINIESSIDVGFDGKNFTDDEDEYGYAKRGRKKASSYAFGRPDTSLTWSTDSDEAE